MLEGKQGSVRSKGKIFCAMTGTVFMFQIVKGE